MSPRAFLLLSALLLSGCLDPLVGKLRAYLAWLKRVGQFTTYSDFTREQRDEHAREAVSGVV